MRTRPKNGLRSKRTAEPKNISRVYVPDPTGTARTGQERDRGVFVGQARCAGISGFADAVGASAGTGHILRSS